MPHANWRDAVADILIATGQVTPTQHKLAALAGIPLPEGLPRLVAAARLKAALGAELNIEPSIARSDIHDDIIAELQTNEYRVDPPPADGREADAWIRFLRLKRRQGYLEQLQLAAGDVVEVNGSPSLQLVEVSSIGSDGSIYFKGGGGARAWPDVVTVRCRKADASSAATDLRTTAANQAALRSRNTSWSIAKQHELAEYEVEARLTREDVEQLGQVIEAAEDEKPIQQFLESRRQILTALLSGTQFRYCLPRPRLTDKYIPDFLLSDVNSLGVSWVLVELETPLSNVTLADGSQLDKYARKGVSQVEQWREWLIHHLSQARRSRREADGLGLFDIRPESEGLVLVGRRALRYEDEQAVRTRIREKDNIHVHTYDWLLDKLTGILNFNGSPAHNPHLLKRLRDKQHSGF
jgi:hypothetical protein